MNIRRIIDENYPLRGSKNPYRQKLTKIHSGQKIKPVRKFADLLAQKVWADAFEPGMDC